MATRCLHPSFEPVHVYIVGHGEGFIVHDDGGAAGTAWDHGVDRADMRKFLDVAADAFDCDVSDNQIRADVVSKDWL